MNYLVDANVLSEPTKPRPDANAIAWLSAHEGDFVVDSVIFGELRHGILSLSAGRKRVALDDWFRRVAQTVECLPWDAATALKWAELLVDLRKRGEVMPLLDSMIA